MNPLQDKRILLGVTGSIACYKAADLSSKLRQAGAEVDVILTEAGAEFIQTLRFFESLGKPLSSWEREVLAQEEGR